jgi:threonine dehydratase
LGQFGLDDVTRASGVVSDVVLRTPVLTSRTLDELVGAKVLLKCENLQRTGSFKFRGAFNTLASLTKEERERGVCAVSSGNHAQALALAAREFGAPAVILMPEDAPPVKIAATRGYGAEVVLYDRYSLPQDEAGRRLRDERGLVFVSSHDDPRISAGAGTAALELIQDEGPIDALIAPVGGGGGMAGYATVVDALCPGARIVGVEAEASRLATRSLAEGDRVRIEVPRTIADGQQLTILGAFPFEVMRRLDVEMVTATEDQILAAMSFLFERLKIVTEPSGAIALAALLAGTIRAPGRRVGIIVSGGNIGARRFASLLEP